MRVLLAVVNCHSRDAFQDAIRSTWLPYKPQELDVIFFRGRGATRDPKPDEVFLDCGDAYLDLPEKVQAIFKWGYEHGYDFVAKCDDDVVLLPQKWYAGFHRTDFSGWQDPGCKTLETKTCWEFLYTLNRRCMKLVIDAKLPGEPGSHWNYKHGNDEAMVASILHYQGIFLTHDPRHFIYGGNPEDFLKLRPKRSLRFTRVTPPKRELTPDIFAAVIYLNWTSWHDTGPEVIIREFYKVWETMKQWQ